MIVMKPLVSGLIFLLNVQEVRPSLLRSFDFFKPEKTELEKDVNIISSNGRDRRVVNPRILQASETFSPLACNSDPWDCQPWPFGLTAVNPVVPCNVCYSMGAFTNGETVTVTGLLDIKGKLDFPEGTKLTLNVEAIVVQGELSMKSAKVVDGTPDIVVQYSGADDVLFTPDAQNAAACNDSTCNLGIKPFVVAGGKLNIDGLPDNCPTWTNVKDLISGSIPEPLEFPQRPILPTPSEGVCEDFLLVEDFEVGLNKWYGNVGPQEELMSHNDGSGSFLHISRRTHEYQGPMVDLSPHIRECLMSDTDYLFTARIRILPNPDFDGTHSSCHLTGTKCPKLQFSHMNGQGVVRWEELVKTDGSISVVDGEWFTLKQAIKIDVINADPTDTFSLFSINGVEPGIDISVDDVSISLPPIEAYPDPANVCSELVINGDAQALGGYAFPITSYIKGNLIKVKEDDGNPYFSITNRAKYYDSITVGLIPECLQSGSIYKFSAKIRLHSETAVSPRIRLVSKIPGQDGWEFDTIQNSCPQTSSETGWTTCEGEISIGPHLSTAETAKLLIMFPLNDSDDADFDDISFSFQSALQDGGIELVDSSMETCYAPGSKILLPSDVLAYDSAQQLTMKAMHAGGIVEVEEEVTRVTTYAESADFATEFAVLSRNILFENENDNNEGPSLVVLNTPNVAQTIKGVEFSGFGIDSSPGKYPINFKDSGDSLQSIVSKNTIRNSNNRCINIDGTNNVNVVENVAYNTIGHCYVLDGGEEIGNTFHKNLGALTKVGVTDTECSTFYFRNPSNTFTGNVAAGSEKNGIWFKLTDLSSTMDFTAFSDNVAHSNSMFGIKTYPVGLKPQAVNSWSNTKVYRNLRHGVIFHTSQNIHLNGGIISDNRIGLEIWLADNMKVSNMEVEGYSESFKNIADSVIDTVKHCDGVASVPISGIRLHPNAYIEGTEGTLIENVNFAGFSQHCNPSSSAIVFNANLLDPVAYTTSIEVKGASFDALSATRNEMSLCAVHNNEVLDIFVVDDGGLNPNSNGPGLVVSNDANMTQSGTCTSMAGSCAQYCTGVDMDLFIGDSPADGPPESPADSPPDTKSPTSAPNQAPLGDSLCIQNGDFEGGLEGWSGAHSSLSLSIGVGGSLNSVKSSSRTHSARGGLSQTISTSCLTADEWYELSADVLLTDAGSHTFFVCDPSLRFYTSESCAGINLLVNGAIQEVGFTSSPLQSGWNKIHGSFQASSSIMAQSSINVVVSRPSTNVDITVDNLILSSATANTVGVTDCSSPIINGNAEVGDARGWFIRGHGNNGSIQMVSPGYGGSSYAFRHVGSRSDRLFSMVNIIDGACFTAGSTWTMSAKFRYMDDSGNFAECNKSTRFNVNSCPVFSFFAGNSVSTGALQNDDTSPMVVGEWNRIENSFTVTAEMENFAEMWVNVFAQIGSQYDIDDIILIQN